MLSTWDRQAYLARIRDQKARKRHPAASPDETDIACYRAAVEPCSGSGVAIVLGMTPELRILASRRFSRVICAERDAFAIELYREWLDERDRRKEEIVRTDWLDLHNHIREPVSAILGDGVFGNLANTEEHRNLLRILWGLLEPQGRLVTRMAYIPGGFEAGRHTADKLLQRFRGGEIDEAEFGFGMRLVGHLDSCYDHASHMLDNEKIFKMYDEALASHALSLLEHECIRRYYFGGKNCIVTQDIWEDLLEEVGFEYRIHRSAGKEWREYYVVYECIPLRRSA